MISLTESAQSKILEVLTEEGPDAKLRMFVQGGGCSGFSYGFGIDNEALSDDIIVSSGAVTVLVDPDSAEMLNGAVVDYKDDLEGARFAITNPQAKSCCGCGSSFSPC